MSMLRTAVLRSVRANASLSGSRFARPTTIPKTAAATTRLYSSHTGHGAVSNTNWFVGSLIIFGPLLFYLTSPPEPKKRHAADFVPQVVHKIEDAVAAVKTPAKPYVLVGSGTASYSAAQAIKEQEPNANVIIIGNESVPPYMR